MISPEVIAGFGTLLGSLLSGVVTIIYWLVKVRKDLDAAHAAIREIRGQKKRTPNKKSS